MHPGLAHSFFETAKLIDKAILTCWQKLTGTTDTDPQPKPENSDEENVQTQSSLEMK